MIVKLVMIEWLDSARPIAEWQHLSGYKCLGPVECASVGFLIHDDGNVIALAPNMGDIRKPDSIQASGIIHIPVCSITKRTDLVEK